MNEKEKCCMNENGNTRGGVQIVIDLPLDEVSSHIPKDVLNVLEHANSLGEVLEILRVSHKEVEKPKIETFEDAIRFIFSNLEPARPSGPSKTDSENDDPEDGDIDFRAMTRKDVMEMLTDSEIHAYDLIEQVALGGDDYVPPENVHERNPTPVQVFDNEDVALAISSLVAFESAIGAYILTVNLLSGYDTRDETIFSILDDVDYEVRDAIDWLVLVSKKFEYTIAKAIEEASAKSHQNNEHISRERIAWYENALDDIAEEMQMHLAMYGYGEVVVIGDSCEEEE